MPLALLAAVSACQPRARRARQRVPRIVLVSFDTLNVQYTGVFDPEVGTTPNLQAFAREAVVFEHAYTRVPLTLPSHTALLSGRSPETTGVLLNGDRVPEALPTLPRLLSAGGWSTAAFVAADVLVHRARLDGGFDHYDDGIVEQVHRYYRTADEVLERVVPWVEQHRGEPFFLWVHFFDPHEPYVTKGAPPDAQMLLDERVLGAWNLALSGWHRISVPLPPGRHRLSWRSLRPPPSHQQATALAVTLRSPGELAPWFQGAAAELGGEHLLRPAWELELENPGPTPVQVPVDFEGRLNAPAAFEVRSNYPREVAFADHHFGVLRQLFEELDLDAGTLWIVVSDHGEAVAHRGNGHARFAFEDQLRVLWMLRGVGLPEGLRVQGAPVLLEDVAPTVLDLLGLPQPEGTEGRSWRGCWAGGGCEGRRVWWAYGAAEPEERVTAVAGYRWPFKALWDQRWGRQLFDLAGDPRERVDLPPAEVPDGARLLEQLEGQRDRFQELLRRRSRPAVPEAGQEALRALGYLD